jgi:PIN domain nuclease of toxin-antitoxin system
VGGDALRLLLDTHTLLWWLDMPGAPTARLTAAQNRALELSREINEPLGVAAITLWEIAKAVELRRVHFDHELAIVLRAIEQHPLIRIIRLDGLVALDSVKLGAGMRGSDPADQLIVATARVHGLRLVTSDERIRRSDTVPVI